MQVLCTEKLATDERFERQMLSLLQVAPFDQDCEKSRTFRTVVLFFHFSEFGIWTHIGKTWMKIQSWKARKKSLFALQAIFKTA